ncbi:TRAP transporter substrate-binding protein [Rhodobium gokarnense]|uniref:TRAP-type C4-dicarboxylate transport system substrate-binding protein n=1 Tax=Rhodobium gokarnense TaxID=364296 RepID=A0ABT3HAW4_9HYPH|nr:TRAP transporter substrate-binding protein [Rhodobium gokarnense]MCW2307520.1 TRAP-type C4-dicarboxylate transport system substrate-binding protein [Rhodobium gokarnense]
MKKILMTAAAATAVALASFVPASAADVTIRLGHLWPSVAGIHKDLLVKWGEKVEADSEGRISVEIYPSSTLAKPPAQYDAVTTGIMDATMTIQGYSANRFPLTQIVELPGLAKNGRHGSCILQGLYDEGLLADEYTDTHPLFLMTHGPGLIHTAEKTVKVPGDLAGLRIRRPTTVVAKLLEDFGAQPVGMPAPASYQSMQRGVIDGVALPWEGALAFRLNELAEHHTEVGGLYTLSFVVTMNKRVYDGLPDDLKKVIDDNSGKEWSGKGGDVFDALDVKGRKQAEEAGHEIIEVEGGIENPDWKPALTGATEAYIKELQDKGLPGQKVYDRALELAQSCL